MKITEYQIPTSKAVGNITVACVSDLHARKYGKVIATLKQIEPELILLAGDILEVSNEYMRKRNKYALDFLSEISSLCPIYYCFGNHEIYYSHAPKEKDRKPDPRMLEENIEKIRSYGINLINDSFEKIKLPSGVEIFIGGLVCGRDKDPSVEQGELNIEILNEFEALDGFKILLCHYPHYYEKHLKNTSMDIILSGHAHGGQWRIFGRGIYAPHQGLFPKYTSGIRDGRFIISRGAVNNSKPIPRFFNPTEILKISISQK